MSIISMRDLFNHREIEAELISLRHSLANHDQGLQMGLREAHARFLQPANGDGYSRGCQRPDAQIIEWFGVDIKEAGGALPNWVSVENHETRTIEGILEKSKVAASDFPFKPWHTDYDWQFHVRIDKQYSYLSSPENYEGGSVIECEWDTGFLPSWAWPQPGHRVWIVGRWVYDCGHAGANGHRTEIHPPKAVVSFRSEAVKLPGNSGPTRANNAILYIGRKGGYWEQPINDQDYAFDLYLPPKPYAEAEPKWVVNKTLRVHPIITPFPHDSPRLLRVVIPLKGVTPHPEEYGAIISAGWSDPQGTEAKKIKRVRVTVEKIYIDERHEPSYDVPFAGNVEDFEWYVYVGINGRWRIYKSLNSYSASLDHGVELDLHPDDRIHITACGREADEIHDLMNRDIGVSWPEIEDHSKSKYVADKIKGGFLSLKTSLDANIENDAIGFFSKIHTALETKSFIEASEANDYRLQYRIEAL